MRFPDNKEMKFTRLDSIYASGSSAGIHAEGRWVNDGETDDDPRASHGRRRVRPAVRPDHREDGRGGHPACQPRRYDDLVFAGFSFDGPAQAVIDEGRTRRSESTSPISGPT